MTQSHKRRKVYKSVDQVLSLLLNNKIKLSTLYTHRHRCLFIYGDPKQAELIQEAIKLYNSYNNIKHIKI